jgi:hypothetical protein
MFNFSAKISPLARQPILMHKNKYPCGVFVFCAVHARTKMIFIFSPSANSARLFFARPAVIYSHKSEVGSNL